MKVVLDIECNALVNPTKVWVIVCKDLDSGQVSIFRNILDDPKALEDFKRYADGVSHWIGHNVLEYDLPILSTLTKYKFGNYDNVTDTLIISRLVNYSRPTGHSLESYGDEFNFPKLDIGKTPKGLHNPFFNQYSERMEEYCKRDVDITEKVYALYLRAISDPKWQPSIQLEHNFQIVVNDLHSNGFCFNTNKASRLLTGVTKELEELDKELLNAFPPKLEELREIHPKLTKHGTLNRSDFRWVQDGDLSEFNGGPFCLCRWKEFNPSSHKQLIKVLCDAQWKPTDKTKTHIEAERERDHVKLETLKRTGWKINENNLSTLPARAPKSARLLAKRILLESRRRTLTEWLGLVENGRIHGKFVGIGAWTHRMAHQEPNTANIPNEFDISGKKKLLGKEMRSLWCAPKNRLLVGVDAEGIQLRIFAHYIDDKEFTDALVNGKKEKKTDPHSLNQRILGSVCKTRASAKRFIYALLLGAGIGKLAEILECSISEAREALNRLLYRYTGFALLKEKVIPGDARRGFFVGLDGRKVQIPGTSISERAHLAMSGYLQNGEAVVMKSATLKWHGILKSSYNSWLVNFVHDEWQVETPNDIKISLQVAKIMADSLKAAGEELELKCPLAGSYWNDDAKDYTIGTNWSVTH